jgi:glycosyltransferase involved in cell wall biosynthesis
VLPGLLIDRKVVRMTDNRSLIVVFEMTSTTLGGIQVVTAALLPELLPEFRVVVIDPYNHPEFAAMLRKSGVEVVSIGPTPRRRYIGGETRLHRLLCLASFSPWLILTMWRWRRWVKRERPDVVYFNQLPAVRVFGRAIAGEKLGLVYHLHGATSSESIGRRTARFLTRRFARLLAVSKITAEFLIGAGVDRAKTRVVYNALDAEEIRRRAEEDGDPLPAKPPGCVVFVHIGVMTRHKKAQHLGVEALALLDRHANVHLWICGDVRPGGDVAYREELKHMAVRLGLKERVHFLGWRNDVPRVVKASDVCILPSVDHSESFGMVLAEAMAQSKPCIGSNMGGIPEVIEDGVTGMICEPNAKGLADAMARMVESDDIRRKMGEAGRRRVESVFSLRRQVDEVAEALSYAATH